MVTLTGAQTIGGGVKTFTVSPLVPTKPANDNSSAVANTSYVDSAVNSLSSSVQSTYQPIASMSSYLTTASASSTYQPIASMSNYLTTTSASSTYQPIASMSSYLTTASASSTYQPIASMTSYPQTSTSNTFTNTNEFSTDLISNKFIEKYITGTVTSNALSLNFSTLTSNILSISPSSASNIALTITNLPTTRTAIYSFTFFINTTTNKNYINTININGSSITMSAMGGVANISVTANLIIQNIFIQMNNATVSNVITNISNCS